MDFIQAHQRRTSDIERLKYKLDNNKRLETLDILAGFVYAGMPDTPEASPSPPIKAQPDGIKSGAGVLADKKAKLEQKTQRLSELQQYFDQGIQKEIAYLKEEIADLKDDSVDAKLNEVSFVQALC